MGRISLLFITIFISLSLLSCESLVEKEISSNTNGELTFPTSKPSPPVSEIKQAQQQNQTQNEPEQVETVNTSSGEKEDEKENEASYLQIINVNIDKGDDLATQASIQGEVINNYNKKIEISGYKIVITFYDDAKRVVASGTGTAILSTLEPKEKSPFKFTIDKVDNMKTHSIKLGK